MPFRSATVAIVFALLTSSCGRSNSCPQTFAELPPEKKAAGQAECSCASTAPLGAVWGNGIYTTDSSICAAAIHAGAATTAGGPVTLKTAPGCPSYKGGPRNGIVSEPWGTFSTSFYFVRHGDGKCPPP